MRTAPELITYRPGTVDCAAGHLRRACASKGVYAAGTLGTTSGAPQFARVFIQGLSLMEYGHNVGAQTFQGLPAQGADEA